MKYKETCSILNVRNIFLYAKKIEAEQECEEIVL